MAINLEALATAYGWTVDGDTYRRDGEVATAWQADGKVNAYTYAYNGRSAVATAEADEDLTAKFLELITPRPGHSIAES